MTSDASVENVESSLEPEILCQEIGRTKNAELVVAETHFELHALGAYDASSIATSWQFLWGSLGHDSTSDAG